jgi:hypothetical protein
MAARKFDQNRLDQLVKAAKASEHPYAALEGKPFDLSASVARTLVVSSGLSKSAPEIVEREKARIAKWLEQGQIGPAKAKPKAVQVLESGTDTEAAQDESIAIHDAAAAGVDAAYTEAKKARKRASRKPRKDGQPSDTAKAIAKSRNGRVRTRQATP